MADAKTTKTKAKSSKAVEPAETEAVDKDVHEVEEEVPFAPVTPDLALLNERLGYPITEETGAEAPTEPDEVEPVTDDITEVVGYVEDAS